MIDFFALFSKTFGNLFFTPSKFKILHFIFCQLAGKKCRIYCTCVSQRRYPCVDRCSGCATQCGYVSRSVAGIGKAAHLYCAGNWLQFLYKITANWRRFSRSTISATAKNWMRFSRVIAGTSALVMTATSAGTWALHFAPAIALAFTGKWTH